MWPGRIGHATTALAAFAALCACAMQAHAQRTAAATTLRFEVEIGTGNDARQNFFRVAAVEVDEERNLWVLDAGDHAVKAFRADGTFLRSFGREGGGPGEFLRPIVLRVQGDTVSVYDAQQQRVSRFSRAGEHRSTEPLYAPANLTIAELSRLRDGRYLGSSIYRAAVGSEEHDPNVRLVLFRPGSERVDTLATMPGNPVVWYVPDQRAPWGAEPSPFGDGGAFALSGDSLIATVDGYAGSVSFHRVDSSGLRLLRTVDLGARGRPITAADLDRLRRDLDARRRTPLPRDVRFLTPPQWSIVTGRAFFGAHGTLWVERNSPAGSRPLWTRVDPASGAVDFIELINGFSLRAAAGDRLYGVWTDANDVQTVRVYRLDR